MSTINITINDLSTMNTSVLGKLVKQMRRDEYLKIMAAFPVGSENAMTADQIAAITNTTSAMVSIMARCDGCISSCNLFEGAAFREGGVKSKKIAITRRWMEIDENGTPTGVIKKEDREVTVYWVERKITLDDLL